MHAPALDGPEAAALIAAARALRAQGWCPAASGAASCRPVGSAGFLISRSGVDLGDFSAASLVAVDADGAPTAPGGRPPADAPLHAMLYARDPSVGAVLHTHSLRGAVLSRVAREAGARGLRLQGWELLKELAGVTTHEAAVKLPIFDNAQDMPALARRARQVLAEGPPAPGFLLAGHGLYAWGRDVAEAQRHVEVFEFLFECVTLQGRLRGPA